MAEAGKASKANYGFTDMSLRNAEVVQAMGMMPGLLQRWSRDRDKMLERQATASDRAATTASAIKFLRLVMQSLILGLGAYLVIDPARARAAAGRADRRLLAQPDLGARRLWADQDPARRQPAARPGAGAAAPRRPPVG